MTVIVSRAAHTWAASHRLLLALAAFAIALTASVAIVMTSAHSTSPSTVQAPGREQTAPQNPAQPDDLNRARAELEKRCLQRMLVAC